MKSGGPDLRLCNPLSKRGALLGRGCLPATFYPRERHFILFSHAEDIFGSLISQSAACKS